MLPTIVISAFNRPTSLRRLLAALMQAHYPLGGGVRLVISVDAARERGDSAARAETLAGAQSVEWPHGPKEVIAHPQPLGLIGNVFFCLGLSQTCEAIIYLEDDYLVSQSFYAYASQALSFYGAEEGIANVSLYGLWFNGYTHEPFVPLPDESDVFFVNTPFLPGQAFTREQWSRFEQWRSRNDPWPTAADGLHSMFERFPKDDWFPILAKYAVTTGRYVVYPRVSLCVAAGDAGAHFSQPTPFFQTPMQGFQSQFRFKSLDDSLAVYDSFFELLPNRLNRLADSLHAIEYDVDLYATKSPQHLRAPYVLTTRPSRAAERAFGLRRWPMEMNVVVAEPGRDIVLCRKEHLRWGPLADWRALWRRHRYFTRGRRLPMKLVLLELLDRIRKRK